MKNKLISLLIFCIFSSLVLADAHILVYHRFGDPRYSTSNIKIEKLRKDFEYLKEKGFKVVKLEEIINKIEKQEEIPDNWVALTIDDAYKTFYTNGLPVFKEFNYPFTLFVNTQAVNDGYGDFINWDEIKEISKYGSIGSHSHTHPHSTKISSEELREDLRINSELFDIKYGGKIESYTHPYSEYNQEVLTVVKEFNFRAIFNQTSGAVSHKSDIYDLNRIAIGNDNDMPYWLRVKYLTAKWEEVKIENNIVKKIKVKMSQNIDKVEMYISGYGWKWHKVADGYLNIELDTKLKLNVSRIMIRTNDNRWSSYLYVK